MIPAKENVVSFAHFVSNDVYQLKTSSPRSGVIIVYVTIVDSFSTVGHTVQVLDICMRCSLSSHGSPEAGYLSDYLHGALALLHHHLSG